MHHVSKGSCFCKICGAHLMASHPRRPSVDVYAATIPLRRQMPALEPARATTSARNVDETILP
jgi:hypothetical protein